MKQAWRVTIWGVRGSIPMVSPEYMGYGGNTSCVCLDCGGDTVVLDAGSGLTALGARMAREGRRRADILLGHIHLDHVLGLFSFPLLHEPEAQIHLYADSSQLEVLVRLAGPPLWPVSLADYPGLGGRTPRILERQRLPQGAVRRGSPRGSAYHHDPGYFRRAYRG